MWIAWHLECAVKHVLSYTVYAGCFFAESRYHCFQGTYYFHLQSRYWCLCIGLQVHILILGAMKSTDLVYDSRVFSFLSEFLKTAVSIWTHTHTHTHTTQGMTVGLQWSQQVQFCTCCISKWKLFLAKCHTFCVLFCSSSVIFILKLLAFHCRVYI